MIYINPIRRRQVKLRYVDGGRAAQVFSIGVGKVRRQSWPKRNVKAWEIANGYR